jgi:hypothetical protein
MFAEVARHLLWKQRVSAAHAWRDAERARLEQDAEPSLMRHLLAGAMTDHEMDELEIAPGVWLLPGAPP